MSSARLLDNNHNYIPVSLNSFLGKKSAPCDIFIKLENEKFIKVLKKHDAFDEERIKRYNEHVDTLYLENNDFGNYIETCLQTANILRRQRKVKLDSKTRFEFLGKIADAVLSEALFKELDTKNVARSEQVIEEIIETIKLNNDFDQLLLSMESFNEDFKKHCFGVAIISVMLGHQLKWRGQKTLKILGMAGFFHDIGFKELPLELATKPRADMTEEEVKLYESHPERGVQILSSIPSIPPEVLAVVGDHHEIPNGQGFPKMIKFNRIFPLSRVIHIANKFVDCTFKTKQNPEPMGPIEAIKYIELSLSSNAKSEYIKALKSMIGVDPLKKI